MENFHLPTKAGRSLQHTFIMICKQTWWIHFIQYGYPLRRKWAHFLQAFLICELNWDICSFSPLKSCFHRTFSPVLAWITDTSKQTEIIHIYIYLKVNSINMDNDIYFYGSELKESGISNQQNWPITKHLNMEIKFFILGKIWLVGLFCFVLWHINLCRLFNAKSILCK